MKDLAMPNAISKLVRAAKAIGAYITVVRDPNQLEKIFELRKEIADPANIEEMARHFQRDAQGAGALDQRPRLGALDLQALAALPAGSLGHAFGRHGVSRCRPLHARGWRRAHERGFWKRARGWQACHLARGDRRMLLPKDVAASAPMLAGGAVGMAAPVLPR